jgi:hypothetical protein
VKELCQFLGGDLKVFIALKQHSQSLLAVRNKGEELIFVFEKFEKFENP